MAVQIQLRRGTAAAWTSANPTLANGEIGIESDTNLFKIGNGSTAWTSLSYGGVQGTAGTNGTNGQGVPTGGATGTVLVKNSATNYDTAWTATIVPYEDANAVISSQVFS